MITTTSTFFPTTAAQAEIFDRDVEVILTLRQIIRLASPDKDGLTFEDADAIRALADMARTKLETAQY